MLELIRVITAVVLFGLSGFIGLDLFISGFNIIHLGYALGSLILSYLMYPRSRRKGDNTFLDVLDIIVELPFDLIRWIFKPRGRGSNSCDSDWDVDFDL